MSLDDQYRSGIALIGDIGNEYYHELDGSGVDLQPEVVRMLEYLGPNRQASAGAQKT